MFPFSFQNWVELGPEKDDYEFSRRKKENNYWDTGSDDGFNSSFHLIFTPLGIFY